MNWSTIALIFLAWQTFGNKSTSKLDDLTKLFNDDTRDILSCVDKLSSKNASSEDKTGAILQMMTNPTVLGFAQNLFSKTPQNGSQPPPKQQTPSQEQTPDQQQYSPNKGASPLTNDEGFTFPPHSADAEDFFAPIGNIADAEVKNKLYYFFDNWYLAK